jgi:two-component system sensor histidine kinase HupT/HoxJ
MNAGPALRPRPRARLSARAHAIKRRMAALAAGGAAAQTVWEELTRAMDEAYAALAGSESALQERNAELADAREFADSVFASMSDVLVVCDREGRIEDVNPALERVVGKKRAVLRGLPLLELFADDEARRRVRCLIGKGRPGIVQDCEVALVGRDGGPVPVALNCTPRVGRDGRTQGLVLTGRPVGELRRAYKALSEAHEALQRAQADLVQAEKLASIGRLVAGVAHELNNPVSFVLGNVHVLGRYAGRIRTYLEAVHAGHSSDELARLRKELRIDHALDDLGSLLEGTMEGAERARVIVDALKRLAAPQREPRAEVDLAAVVRRGVHWVLRGRSVGFVEAAVHRVATGEIDRLDAAPAHEERPTEAGHRLQVHFDLPEALPAWGCADHLQQVVMNLVQNAIDATAQVEVPKLAIEGRVGHGMVRIVFTDNGSGIAPEDLRRVFEPFFTTKPVGAGTGLGLAIAHGIVERHGGRIEAGDAPGGGVRITLELPDAESGRRDWWQQHKLGASEAG